MCQFIQMEEERQKKKHFSLLVVAMSVGKLQPESTLHIYPLLAHKLQISLPVWMEIFRDGNSIQRS